MGGCCSVEEPEPEPAQLVRDDYSFTEPQPAARVSTTDYPYSSNNYKAQRSSSDIYSSPTAPRSSNDFVETAGSIIQATRTVKTPTIRSRQSTHPTPLNDEGRQVTKPIKSRANPNIFNLQLDQYFLSLVVVTYVSLSEYDWEYNMINRKITNKKNFKVDAIDRIENPYLRKAYELKKAQKQSMYVDVQDRLLFHGTKREHVDSICKLNFNWRKCRTHKFGKGISFSPNSTYASNYSDKNVRDKVMIVAYVLIGKSCLGHEFMKLPDAGCDTSQKGEDGIVIVKYEDSEFYPAYKINYHLIQENIGTHRKPRFVYYD